MEINIDKIDKKRATELIKAYLDPKHPDNKKFWSLAAVHQAFYAAFNLRAIRPDKLKEGSNNGWSWEAFRDNLPKTLEEFNEHLNYLVALDAVIHAFGIPAEELYAERASINGEETDLTSVKDGVTIFKKVNQKGNRNITIGNGVYYLDLGEFIPERKGELLIGPFCEREFATHSGTTIIEPSIDSTRDYIDDKEYTRFLDNFESQHYEYESSEGHGDYYQTFGKPHYDSSERCKDAVKNCGEKLMRIAGAEIAKARAEVTKARENGAFDDKSVSELEDIH